MFERRIMQDLERLQGVEEFLKKVKQQPRSLKARLNLGQAYLRQGKTEPALEEFANLLKIDPDNPEGHFGQGLCLVRLARMEEAVADVFALLEIDPTHALAHYHWVWSWPVSPADRIKPSRIFNRPLPPAG